MHNDFRPQPNRRATATVQNIRNPLTRIGYSLTADSAYLVLLFSGQIRLRGGSDSRQFQAEGPRLIWRKEGAQEELLAEGGTRGVIVSIPYLTLMRVLPATPLGGQMRRTLGQNLSLAAADTTRFETLVSGLVEECATTEPGSDVSCDYFIALILVQLWRLARAGRDVHDHSPRGLAERFVQLAAQHLREHWQVQDYARTIGVSRDRLGDAVRRATGVSPQGYLHRELLREAQELLLNTGLPVGQIAFRLGFQDPAYFTRFFTREVGSSPSQYRRTGKDKRQPDQVSYAAWP